MIKLELDAEVREEVGSSAVGRLRKAGYIPAVIYGKKEAVNIKLETRNFIKSTHGGMDDNYLVTLSLNDKNKVTALLREMQKDPIKGDILHLDFNEIALDKKIHTSIHIYVVGDSVGVSLGGFLEFRQREVDIECLPQDIPNSIEVDISNLQISDSIHVKDLSVSDKVKILSKEDVTILSIIAPKKEEEIIEEEEAIGEEAKSEPEVINKGKKEEEEEKK
ncbi:50S ribosomal protein L25 [Candidatus Auribacterota bacterium]